MHEVRFFGRSARFMHVGLAVRSIKETSPESTITIEPAQKVSAAFISLNGVTIELLEPYGDDSPIAESIRKNVKLVHLCYAVGDLDKALAESRKHGFHCIAPPAPTVTFDGKMIAWVYSSTFGLFELLEDPSVP